MCLFLLSLQVVPEVTPCMSDTKKQVKEAAIAAMTAACDVIGNRDMEHMTGDIVKAIMNPAEVRTEGENAPEKIVRGTKWIGKSPE